ncbi:hypothetical protein Scep_008872 [Stephania cephalantha]|uniref:Uncharacterized protein n=1 Tax=Stephania cephalantha TaxID=152367 RepID=A0AAP0JS08_9MAGN
MIHRLQKILKLWLSKDACSSMQNAPFSGVEIGPSGCQGKYFLFFEISAGLDRTFTAYAANVREHEEQFDAYRMR